jgi:hypothetical protein
MKKPSLPEKDSELRPDAWQHFERAVDVVAKSPPQHRTKQKNIPTKEKRTTKSAGVVSRKRTQI